jgi:type I site-specific restriction endonuclease
MTRQGLSEADICAKHITPELIKAGWDGTQIRREVYCIKGRIAVRGKLAPQDLNAEPASKLLKRIEIELVSSPLHEALSPATGQAA